MTDRSHELPQDQDLRNIVRVVLSLHIRPLGICSRLLIGVFSVFMIVGRGWKKFLERSVRTPAGERGTSTITSR